MAEPVLDLDLRGYRAAIPARARVINRLAVQSVNRAAAQARTQVSKQVRKERPFKLSLVRRFIRLQLASTGRPMAAIAASGRRRITLRNLDPRQVYAGRGGRRKRAGISARTVVGGTRVRFRQAFFPHPDRVSVHALLYKLPMRREGRARNPITPLLVDSPMATLLRVQGDLAQQLPQQARRELERRITAQLGGES